MKDLPASPPPQAESAGFRPSPRTCLLLLTVSLALLWSLPSGSFRAFVTLGLLAGMGGLLAHRMPGAVLLFGSLLVTAVATTHVPHLTMLGYEDRLRLEAISALLPPLVILALAHVARARTRAPASRWLLAVAFVLALLGSLVRLAETWFLFGRPGDAATLEHALRADLALSLWGAAAWAVAFGLLARWVPEHRPLAHRTGAFMGAFVGFLLVTSGTPVMVETGAAPTDLMIGFHADRVADVPESADLVHLEAAMPRVEPADGVYDWRQTDAQLQRALARGLDVYLLISTYPPDWLQKAYPESVMSDADGEPFLWIDEDPNIPHSGRVWDMSFADPRVFDAKAEFVAKVAARYGDHPNVRWVAVVNEPAYPVGWNLLRWASFDEATVLAFRESLRAETSGDLALLEKLYGVEAESWDDVSPPRVPFGGLGERWMHFREQLLVTHTVGLMDAAREHTDRPVTTKLMAHFLTRFAEPQAGLSDWTYRELAKASDVVSIDLYPATRADLERQLVYFEAISDGKPIIVAEFNLALGTNLPFAGLRMLSALESISRHADAVILFTASDHFLYGISDDSAAMEATRMVRMGFRDGGYAAAFEELWKRELVELARFPAQARDVSTMALAAGWS